MSGELKAPMLVVLLPSMRISGGVQETLRLAHALAERGVEIRVVSLWRPVHGLSSEGLAIEYLSDSLPRRATALFELPLLMFRYLRMIMGLRKSRCGTPALLITHYITFPFSWLTPGCPRFCFNQDLEWMFLPEGLLRSTLRRLILGTSRRSKVLTTNDFISTQYQAEDIALLGQASIWAPEIWSSGRPEAERCFDLVVLLRHAEIKRLDLYLDLLKLCRESGSLRCAVITPESDIPARVEGMAELVLLRPSNEEIKAVYARSKVFLLLSDTEGFGLPPLEAMGSGCVPICRDSGGVRCYMTEELAENLVPKGETMRQVLKRIVSLLGDSSKLAELSLAAKRIFAEGHQRSRAEREICMDRFAGELFGLAVASTPAREASPRLSEDRT